jgi:diguanylate cyclase
MPRLINPKSMANRLILAGMAIILLNASIQFGLLDRHLRQDLTELTSNQLLTLANYVAAQIDRDLVKRRELLRHVAGHLPPALLDDRIALHDRLAEHQAVNPLFSEGLVVLDESGRVIADHPPCRAVTPCRSRTATISVRRSRASS